ncbi:MAG TPA: hypothetical protein VMA77_08205 [Solirubrobacteraceae bacterium]|nr:hypothetical protein [Solirubrobacteraceae bacterium]
MSFSEDPTQGAGATPGEDPTGTGAVDSMTDPTQGVEVGEQPYEDPTQGDEVGEGSYEDSTQGQELGSSPGEDPTAAG